MLARLSKQKKLHHLPEKLSITVGNIIIITLNICRNIDSMASENITDENDEVDEEVVSKTEAKKRQGYKLGGKGKHSHVNHVVESQDTVCFHHAVNTFRHSVCPFSHAHGICGGQFLVAR